MRARAMNGYGVFRATPEKDFRAIEREIEALLDRIVEADGAPLVTAYDERIRDLETKKVLMRERIASCGRPLASFGETYRREDLDALQNAGEHGKR